MAISSPGLGSNLDVNSIVSQLMALEQKPLTAGPLSVTLLTLCTMAEGLAMSSR